MMATKPAPDAAEKKSLFFETLAFDPWAKHVAAMPAEQQLKAVSKKLMELNPGFDGKVTGYSELGTPTFFNGVVTGLGLLTENVTDISPVRSLVGLTSLSCVGSEPGKGRLVDLSPLAGMKLTHFICSSTQVADLSPLKSMSLVFLSCVDTKVSDLAPLEGMPIAELECYFTTVSDLSPLQGMKLIRLSFGNTQVSNLSPLKGMPLTFLAFSNTQVADLLPLNGMSLTEIQCYNTQVSDFSLLKDMPLKHFNLEFQPSRDTELLRSIKTLETINFKPTAEFWKEVEEVPVKKLLGFQLPGFDEWVKQVQAMPADKQVEAVSKKLVELNPGFDGKVTQTIENGVVTGLVFVTDNVTDISPVRALTGLRVLSLNSPAIGKLVDLSPLSSLKLTSFECHGTQVADLSPLRGMPLIYVNCSFTHISDLAPLAEMSLEGLSCASTPVSDLSPLHGQPLTGLNINQTQVTVISPLRGLPLIYLNIGLTQISDLSILRTMPLTSLLFDYHPQRDTELLRSIPSLSEINQQPAAEFWRDVADYSDSSTTLGDPEFQQWIKDVSALSAEEQVNAVSKKLQELNPSFDGKIQHKIENGVVTELKVLSDRVWNISPVRVLDGLRSFDCSGSSFNEKVGNVSDLSPLVGMRLTDFTCIGTLVSNLTPLHGMPLNTLNCGTSHVFDLTPLRGMPLSRLECASTPLTNLTPIKELPLKHLNIAGTLVRDLSSLQGVPLLLLAYQGLHVTDISPIRNLPLRSVYLDFKPERDTELLRSIKTLEGINDKPVAEFWKDVEGKN